MEAAVIGFTKKSARRFFGLLGNGEMRPDRWQTGPTARAVDPDPDPGLDPGPGPGPTPDKKQEQAHE